MKFFKHQQAIVESDKIGENTEIRAFTHVFPDVIIGVDCNIGTHVFIGNADTRILLNGTREEIRSEVKRCMDIGKKYPGFFMAVGNCIPSNTPVDNALYYNQVYEEMSWR